jgi:hypothetical protein
MGVVKHRYLWVELRISPQHMIQNTDVGVAEFLRGVHKIAHHGKVCTDFDGRKADTNTHHSAPLLYGFFMASIQVFYGRGNPCGCPRLGRHEACPYMVEPGHG